MDVREAFLHNAEQRRLYLLRKPSDLSRHVQLDCNAASLCKPVCVPTQRGVQTPLVEQGRMQQVRKVTDFGRKIVLPGRQCQQGISGHPHPAQRISQQAQVDGYRSQIMSRTVMQLSGNSPAFLVLRLEQTGRKLTQFPLYPLPFSDVT